MTAWADLTPETQRLMLETADAMKTHKGAHAMWGEEPPDVLPWTDCGVCGLKWRDQMRAIASGGYICAYSQRGKAATS